MPIDVIKELGEFVNFIMTDENAQLTILIGTAGAVLTAVLNVAATFLLVRQT